MISCCAERAPLIAMVSPACAPASASSSEPHLRPPIVTDMPASRVWSSQTGGGSPALWWDGWVARILRHKSPVN